jgi:uncharacterized protein (TIGR03066 family)
MKLIPWAFVACLLLGLTATGRTEEKKADKEKSYKEMIVGTWVLEKPEVPKSIPAGYLRTSQFTDDGKLVLTGKLDGKAVNVEGTYLVDGDKLKTTTKNPDGKEQSDTATITKLTDKELVIKDSKTDEMLTFKKK